MNTETRVRKVLDEWSTEARVPPGLADRALGRRTGRRHAKAVLVVAVAVLVVATGVMVGIRRDLAPGRPVDTSLHIDTTDAPPKRLVAAGRVALSAYRTLRVSGKKVVSTWYLYNPRSGGYQKLPWAWLAVAPGMRQAAVLDGPLPSARVGIIDMDRQTIRWIGLKAAAGGLAWSPDGRRLLVTTYATDPDANYRKGTGARTGFIVVDPRSGQAHFHSLLFDPGNGNGRQDLGWSRDGSLIWAPTMNFDPPTKLFYDLNGVRRPAPAHEADSLEEAEISPNGRLIAVHGGASPGLSIVDTNGRTVSRPPVMQLVAWTDDTHVIAVTCDLARCGGPRTLSYRYVLMSIDGKTSVPLTGYKTLATVGSWDPVFTHR
ncbi:hypothetical protein [Actinoallomurus acaciae]|uniref:WD40 repeat domain-containing protein n=1 Tax=Actinoallomurus acaciae TaxID=502577 RepID=A0ABV5YAL9_9ACTN